MVRKLSFIVCSLVALLSCSSTSYPSSESEIGSDGGTYKNPIIQTSLPDPTIIKSADGYYYLYATEDIHNVPIYRTKDLVKWSFVGTAFTEATRPSFVKGGGIWAPDINYINGKYVLYYAMSTWGGEWECGIGVAVADSPAGPFTDKGKLFISKEIGVQNSIDPFYIEDGGKKYLFWGSFRGIYGTELNSDGLSLKKDAPLTKIADTMMEATYICKKGGYYYLFGSNGTCCEGANSTYKVVYGRSSTLFGPYLTKDGKSMLNNDYEELLHRSDTFVGTGHNAEFITDKDGNDWMIYHAFLKKDPDAGRVLMMDKVCWKDGWPYVSGSVPTVEEKVPVLD